VRKSVTPDAIICLEDGKSFKSLKRHLRTTYDMTPEQYRAKWHLPADYPMVAPNYAQARSELAKTMGLGQQRNKGKASVEVATEAAAPAKGRRTKNAA
jgi:predicted transcriptional regulator